MAFDSSADNLIGGDTNGYGDVFVRDRGGEEPPSKPAVLLVHGFGGFGVAQHCSDGAGRLGDPNVVNTFDNLAYSFRDAGYDVWIAHLDTGPLGTPPIQVNAQCLQTQVVSVTQKTKQPVILVAHSMGGLVSRACLNLTDCRNNVKALYTLG